MAVVMLALSVAAASAAAQGVAHPAEVLTLGDIDPDTPAKRVRKLEPFANHLGERLAAHGVARVKVVIARDIEEMARRIAEGSVDVYMDSPYPVLRVKETTGALLIARRWVREALEYHSVFFTADPRIRHLDDLPGRAICLQEVYSTSGYALPAAYLRQLGFSLVASRAGTQPSADEIGFVFSRDEENTVAMVESGRVAAGAIASTDFDLLPADRKSRLRVLGRTPSVPRILVLARRGLDARLLDAMTAELLSIDAAAIAERAERAGDPSPWTWRFEPPPSDDDPGLLLVRETLQLLSR